MGVRFTGTYYRSLDAKGRLLLPPRFLEAIAAGAAARGEGARASFWLTSLYGRVTAYLPETWENTVSQLCGIKLPSLKLSNFKTKLIGMAEELEPDGQGRIRVPRSLMREGGFQKEVVLVGVLEKFEIWDTAKFDALPNEDVSDELAASGLDIFL